ncbi:Flp pilus assembly protein CpaB [Caldinitratiruptor microaerophilus]|uniref:SAF domain-containing protein n=1 Tax=Caldinitratiruptor microaerophilus TaxID=671077 RepID=A0AA35CKT3_9FIRM|nr:Flp pilus assembly protein CpaB [Caldinitratiruptor microaerophilus]BDG60248.1 hypothetical protein caldi_13380 [Caldinitratiruptor microaerophilus]
MSGRWARLFLIPTLAGLVAASVAYAAVGRRAAGAAVEMVPVLVARTAVPARTPLTADQFEVRQAPRDLAAGAVSGPDAIRGRIAQTDVPAGAILLQSHLADPARAALPFRIPAGRRAVTVAVNETSGAGGYPQPGDQVDLILVLSEPGGGAGSGQGETAGRPRTAQARLLLQGVTVLARGPAPAAKPGDDTPRASESARLTSYTLALTPAEAVEVALAEAVGHLKLVLRPAVAEADVPPVILDDTRYGLGR